MSGFATQRKGRHESLLGLGRHLHARGLIVGSEGNLSCRLPGGQILITPAGRAKNEIGESDLALLDQAGRTLRGNPSSESILHAELYRACPKANVVIHAHPPVAVAWSLAHPGAAELPAEYLAASLLTFGRIPIARYARPGSADLAKSVLPFLPECQAIILSRHGAVTWGESVEEAQVLLEQLEQVACILRDTFRMGNPQPLPPEEVKSILAGRKS